MTSYLFPEARFSQSHLEIILEALEGGKSKLVIDLSCRRQGEKWVVAMNKWQTVTNMEVNEGKFWNLSIDQIERPRNLTHSIIVADTIEQLEPYCSEFLIHAADNEGLQKGIDEDLVKKLGEWCSIPVTYAGGGRSMEDFNRVKDLSAGKVDLTIGSALDIFGGKGVSFKDCVEWNTRQ